MIDHNKPTRRRTSLTFFLAGLIHFACGHQESIEATQSSRSSMNSVRETMIAGEGFTDEGIVGEVAAGEVAAGEVAAGEVTAGEVTAGEVAAGEVAAGEVTAGEVAAGEPLLMGGNPDPQAGTNDTLPIVVEVDRPILNLDEPGGWANSTFVFSQAALRDNMVNDDWVQLGWFTLNTSEDETACGHTGPRVTRVYYQWKHDNYPVGNCSQDVNAGVHFDRWDHSTVNVDECPGMGSWVEATGEPSARNFLYDCPAHMPAGYGKTDARKSFEGTYQYYPEAAELRLFYNVPTAGGETVCRKEFYKNLTLSEDGQLLAMELDDDRSDETISLGANYGFAYGSSASFQTELPLAQSAAILNQGFLAQEYSLKENGTPPLIETSTQIEHHPVRCRDDVFIDHSCVTRAGDPYLSRCDQSSGETAYLQFWVDPFPNRATREHLIWSWFALYSPNWTGCFHRGTNSYPSLQVIGSDGSFRGYVGVKFLRSSAVSGGVEEANSYLKTHYQVFRWIKDGSQELHQ